MGLRYSRTLSELFRDLLRCPRKAEEAIQGRASLPWGTQRGALATTAGVLLEVACMMRSERQQRG